MNEETSTGKKEGGDGWVGGWVDGWVDRWINGWVSECMDGWMDGAMHAGLACMHLASKSSTPSFTEALVQQTLVPGGSSSLS